VDESDFLVVFADSLVASETVKPQVSLSFGSRFGLSPLYHSKSEMLTAVGAFDGELVNVPCLRWEVAPELLVVPLEGDCPDGRFDRPHDIYLPALNIVLDGLAKTRAGPPLTLKPL